MSYSGTELPRSTPLQEKVSTVAIEAFSKSLDRLADAKIRGFMLSRNGKVIAEQYWTPYSAENKNLVYSLSKSFTSSAVGIAYDEGLIDLNAQAISFFPELDLSQVDENTKKIRVRDLLAMDTGHNDDTTVKVLFSPESDWEKTFFTFGAEHEPGTYFVYNTGATYILSSIITRVTGVNVLEYLKPRLFEPLGFGDYTGDIKEGNVFTGGWGLMVTLEDINKLGILYLNKGVYNGKRIISEEYVTMATSVQSDNGRAGRDNESIDWSSGYGFQFWICSHNSYRGDGAFGQYCLVMPEQNAVLTLMSETADMQVILNRVWEILQPGCANCYSEWENKIQNLTYSLKGDIEDADTCRFIFREDSLTLEMRDGEKIRSIESGRGIYKNGIYTLPFSQRSLIPLFSLESLPIKVSSYFEWTAPDTLEIYWVYLETPHREKLICRFNEGKVDFTEQSSLQLPKDEDEVDFVGFML